MNIGTFTPQLSYAKDGLSNWVQGLALVGPNGEIQALDYQDGEWYTDPSTKSISDKTFFFPGYPKVIPNNEGKGGPGGQIDQYTDKK